MRHDDLLLCSYLQNTATQDGLVQDTQIIVPLDLGRRQQLETTGHEEIKCGGVDSEQRAGKDDVDAGLAALRWI